MPTNHDETLQERYEREHRQMEKSMTTLEADEAQAVPDVGQQINRLVGAAFRKGELWERCQGKFWPEPESAEFTKLRDETIPSAIAQLHLALSAAAPATPHAFEIGPLAPVADPVNDSLDDMAELALHWQRKRLNGRVPVAIRAGMILLAKEIVAHVATDEAIPNNLESQPNG